jgi:O-antigen ligase
MGYGPDTFFLTFPNNDFIGKLRHLSKGIYRLVDKPHNLYLQIAIDTGLLSLISILFLLGAYFIQTQKCLFRSDLTNLEEVVGQSIILAVLAYLVAGFFNDSVNSVAPVFWGLVGLGIAINRIVEKKNEEPAKELDN